eukprot:365938-Chlamydomonas_euryale.AAC.5
MAPLGMLPHDTAWHTWQHAASHVCVARHLCAAWHLCAAKNSTAWHVPVHHTAAMAAMSPLPGHFPTHSLSSPSHHPNELHDRVWVKPPAEVADRKALSLAPPPHPIPPCLSRRPRTIPTCSMTASRSSLPLKSPTARPITRTHSSSSATAASASAASSPASSRLRAAGSSWHATSSRTCAVRTAGVKPVSNAIRKKDMGYALLKKK